MSGEALVHAVAVAVAVDADGPLAGALILGPSGAGKSSLALVLIETCPFSRSALIADDAVLLSGPDLTATAPAAISGLIEIRGFGPAPVRSVQGGRLLAAFELTEAAPRLPDPMAFQPIAGGSVLPRYPFLWKGAEATAPHRLRRIIAALAGGQTPRRIEDRGE